MRLLPEDGDEQAGDGAPGLSPALDELCPETRHRLYRLYKASNVLNALSKSLQGKAKADCTRYVIFKDAVPALDDLPEPQRVAA